MTIDELRAKFEATFSQAPYEWSFARYTERQAWPGSYANYNVQCAWESYQAAHASRDAEVEALRKDAARYRWLRSRVAGTDRKPFICIFHGNFSLWNGEHADCEIDAAMKEEIKNDDARNKGKTR